MWIALNQVPQLADALIDMGGILALLYMQFRATKKVSRGTAIELVSMYWHFMDGLWAFLFLLLYLGR